MPDDLFSALRGVAVWLLGRRELDERILRETAKRLRSLVERAREAEERLTAQAVPAFAYVPTHPAYGTETAAPSGEGAAGARAPAAGQRRPQQITSLATAHGRPTVTADDALGRLSLREQAAAVQQGKVTAVELVERALSAAECLNPVLNAFITLASERALAEAREADRRLAAGEKVGPLHGVPVAVKDIFDVLGIPTTAGSDLLTDFIPCQDATVVRRLRAAGAIVIGKTNTHQFAFGATNESSHVGPARNPWNIEHSPGGSSGGSGAAVSARIVACAMGSDTGGSIRIPAAACGIFGIKPTYGRVSKAGVFPLSWSLDHVGPLAATVADAALVLAVIAGEDPDDPTASPMPVGDYVAAARAGREGGLEGTRVAVLSNWCQHRVDAAIQAAVAAAASALTDAGARVEEIDFVPLDLLILTNRLIILTEAAAHHAPLLRQHAPRYAPDVRARLELGQFMLAHDYLLAQRLRHQLTREVNRCFADFDVLLLPTLPIGAPRIGERTISWHDGEEAVADALIRLTAPFNVTGHPVASVPFGLAANALPAAVQVVGKPFAEETVFRVAAALERAAAATPKSP